MNKYDVVLDLEFSAGQAHRILQIMQWFRLEMAENRPDMEVKLDRLRRCLTAEDWKLLDRVTPRSMLRHFTSDAQGNQRAKGKVFNVSGRYHDVTLNLSATQQASLAQLGTSIAGERTVGVTTTSTSARVAAAHAESDEAVFMQVKMRCPWLQKHRLYGQPLMLVFCAACVKRGMTVRLRKSKWRSKVTCNGNTLEKKAVTHQRCEMHKEAITYWQVFSCLSCVHRRVLRSSAHQH
jgi:hypothetical protein